MANVLSAADIFQVKFEGSFGNDDVQNVFYYAVTSVSGAAQSSQASFTALDAVLKAPAGLANLMLLLSPTQYSLDNIRYQVIKPVRQVAYPIQAGLNGLNTFDTLAGNVAFCLTKRGDRAGRKYISTTHVIGTTDPAIMAAGSLTGAAITLAENIASFMKNTISFTAGGIDYVVAPVIYHPSDPLNPTPITSVLVQSTTRVMRRRTVGLGS